MSIFPSLKLIENQSAKRKSSSEEEKLIKRNKITSSMDDSLISSCPFIQKSEKIVKKISDTENELVKLEKEHEISWEKYLSDLRAVRSASIESLKNFGINYIRNLFSEIKKEIKEEKLKDATDSITLEDEIINLKNTLKKRKADYKREKEVFKISKFQIEDMNINIFRN